jgi:GMP synthase (glutamine-hydrolysing)
LTKSLVVNCSLDKKSRIPELLGAIEEFSEYTVIGFRDISDDFKISRDIDAIVLSGSLARIVESTERDMFKETVKLIKQLDLPMFCICFGHQLLCWSLGAEVASHGTQIQRFEEVRVINDDEIFEGFKKNQFLTLAEHHNDYVVKTSLQKTELVLIADSKSCEVEAIKHQNKPFYGVQFHPERTKINNEMHLEGLGIIKNFYKRIVKR